MATVYQNATEVRETGHTGLKQRADMSRESKKQGLKVNKYRILEKGEDKHKTCFKKVEMQ